MRQFYGHLEKMRSFCRKNHVRKIPLFLGGVFWGGGGSADFIFMGRADFSEIRVAAITLASDSAIAIARFRPSLPPRHGPHLRTDQEWTSCS